MSPIFSAVRIALRAISRSKMRAFLTVLGILIGVSAVVTVVSLGTSVRERVMGEISTLGANTIFIFPQSTQASGARQNETAKLTEADGEALRREAQSVAAIAPLSQTAAQVLAQDRNTATQIMGTNRNYLYVRSYSLDKGAMWTESDELLKSKVCVIGDTVRENLFGTGDGIGQYIRIGRHPFRVIGLLTKKGQSAFGEDQDDRILMPIGSFRARIMPSTPGRVDMIIASATDERTVDRAVSQIEDILRQRHQVDPDDEPDFAIRTQAEFRRSNEAIFQTLTVLLSSIAAISLLVGGIGVMNIMLVSVTERTREIGIRMAIGAKRWDILLQFLIEAITLSFIGGLLGILAGMGLIQLLASLLDWKMRLPLDAVALAVGTSGAIGIIFGFFPARRAAGLDPIFALRNE